jgi:hypothetical protein
MRPLLTASASACSSTMPPRATLMTRSSGLALARRSALMSPTVCGVFATWMVMKSDCATSVSRSTSSTDIWRARSGET